MSLIFNALIYEGILSICALVLYFYVEPKYNVKGKGFFSSKNICMIILSLPFAEFLFGFILQSNSCEHLGNFFCVGTPDILQHNWYYDIFFLRVNDTFNGAHWIDYLFIPIVYFFTWRLTKDPFFSALNSAFMVFIHESIWFLFYWAKYYPQYQFEGWYNDIAFFMLVCTLGFIGIKKYKQFYKNVFFILGVVEYSIFLFAWYMEGFTVSVINNTQLGNSNKFLITAYYNDPVTNEYEVFSWMIVFVLFMLNIYFIQRHTFKVVSKQEIVSKI